MIRTSVFFVMLLLLGIACSSIKDKNSKQDESTEIWTEQVKVNRVIAFEQSLSDDCQVLQQNVSLSKSVFPLLDQYKITKPFIVKRKQTGFLPIYAEYFFSEKDSILRYISYDWERDRYGNLFAKQKIWKEESGKLKEYNQEYEKIKAELIRRLGKPIEEDTELQKKASNTARGDYFVRNTVWNNNEYYAKLNMIFEAMTYRIRFNYYWKK